MLSPGLYVVATPIGRLQDITLKALEILRSVDIILCEDTRVTNKLLQEYQIKKPCMSLHKFNEAALIETLLEKIAAGQSLALVSDAGTPAIHDPGARLVQSAHKHNVLVSAIPGPSSVTAALSIAGCLADKFTFHGFISGKAKALSDELQEINSMQHTVICFESTHRIKNTLSAIFSVIAKEREIVLCKELTKLHESAITVCCADLPEIMSKPETFFKGEWIIIFKPCKRERSQLSDQAKKLLTHLVPLCGASQAVRITRDITGESKKYLYDYAILSRSE